MTTDVAFPTPAGAPAAEAEGRPSPWSWAALALAVVALAGSLSLSWGMNLKACPLCFYQRTFAMSLVAVLGVGVLTGAAGPRRLGLLALPLAAAGLGVALFHVRLELTGKLECPRGLLGLGTAPLQSLIVFTALFLLLIPDSVRADLPRGKPLVAVPGAVLLGGLLAVAACTSNPPMPVPPGQPYAQPPEICRPPFRPAAES